mmetsp:Transcript_3991/g.9009  ORF Transcript_3991/g.9009 Transcript_3991/m.9009 type:complete len:142 (-) Transcript_3991:1032-1457(-)
MKNSIIIWTNPFIVFSFLFCYQSKTSCAKLYRIYKPSAQQNVWKARRTMQRCCSLMGPNICKNKLISVMLTISVFPLLIFEGSINPVRALNFGSRCLGQGTNLNNCGVDQRKLIICGMKNSSRVLEKWPKIPTTANVMPAK